MLNFTVNTEKKVWAVLFMGQPTLHNNSNKKTDASVLEGAVIMRGYHTDKGYMGYVDGEYMLFSCEADYYEFLED